MSRCKTLMEPVTLLCVSLQTLCLFFLLYSPLLFSCHFLLPFPLALPFCLCFFFSHTPPSILHSCFLVKFQKVSLLLSKPCAVIAFVFQLFINTVPLKIKSMLVTESALLWCLSLFWLHKHPYCVNLLEQNWIYPHLLWEEYVSLVVFINKHTVQQNSFAYFQFL